MVVPSLTVNVLPLFTLIGIDEAFAIVSQIGSAAVATTTTRG